MAASATSSNLTDSGEDRTSKQDELLQKMSQEMSLLAKNQEQASQSRRNSDADLLKNIEGLLSAKQQAAVCETLEQTNQELRSDLKEAHTKIAMDKEAFASEKTRLELQLQQSEQNVEQLERLHAVLQDQTASLSKEKSELEATAAALRDDLANCKAKLEKDKDMLQALQQEGSLAKEAWTVESEQWKATAENLEEQLGVAQQSNHDLESTIQHYQEAVERLEKITVPELESQVETERDNVARAEAALEARTAELEQCQATVTALKGEIAELQQQNERERLSFQSLNESSSQAFEKMTVAAQEKDREIAALQEQLEASQQEVSTVTGDLSTANANLQQIKETLLAEQKTLNDALEESMVQLDQVEADKKELEKKLTKALKKLEETRSVVETKDSEMAGVVEGLTNQMAAERERREEAELQVREKDKLAKALEKQLQETVEERDAARNNMQGFNDREQDLYLKLRESDRIRREMHSRIMQLMGNIRVFVRVRPALPGEVEKDQLQQQQRRLLDSGKKRKRGDSDDPTPFRFPSVYERSNKKPAAATSSGDDLTKNLIEVQEPYKDRGGLSDRRKQWRFGFDNVFSPDQGQEQVWEATEPLIQSAVDGFNVTVFAYGQTGSGVSFVCGNVVRLIAKYLVCLSHLIVSFSIHFTENVYHARRRRQRRSHWPVRLQDV